MSWQDRESLIDRIKSGGVILMFHYDFHDETISAMTEDFYMPTKDEFDELVAYWRKFYNLVPGNFARKWNDATDRKSGIRVHSSPEKDGYVYLAYISTGHYKIGISKNPEARIKHFDTLMPVDVEIVHSFHADDARQAESMLHETYEHRHKKGEWFSLTFENVEEIKEIKAFRDGEFLD